MAETPSRPTAGPRDPATTAAAVVDDHRPGYERYRLNEFVGHLIRRAQQIHALLWNEHVPGDVTSPQWAVLHCLARHPGVDQTRVAELASLDRSTTADIARRLVDRDLIRRRRDPADTRRYILEITAAGRAVMELSTPPALEVNHHLVQRLTTEEAQELIRLLNLVVAPATTSRDVPT